MPEMFTPEWYVWMNGYQARERGRDLDENPYRDSVTAILPSAEDITNYNLWKDGYNAAEYGIYKESQRD